MQRGVREELLLFFFPILYLPPFFFFLANSIRPTRTTSAPFPCRHRPPAPVTFEPKSHSAPPPLPPSSGAPSSGALPLPRSSRAPAAPCSHYSLTQANMKKNISPGSNSYVTFQPPFRIISRIY